MVWSKLVMTSSVSSSGQSGGGPGGSGWVTGFSGGGLGVGLVGWGPAAVFEGFDDGLGDEGGAGFVGVAVGVDGGVEVRWEFDAEGFFALVVGEAGAASAAGWGHGDLG
jgi:hypothetical protein